MQPENRHVREILEREEDRRDFIWLTEVNGRGCAAKQWRMFCWYRAPAKVSEETRRRRPGSTRGAIWIARHGREINQPRMQKVSYGLLRERLLKALGERELENGARKYKKVKARTGKARTSV